MTSNSTYQNDIPQTEQNEEKVKYGQMNETREEIVDRVNDKWSSSIICTLFVRNEHEVFKIDVPTYKSKE